MSEHQLARLVERSSVDLDEACIALIAPARSTAKPALAMALPASLTNGL